LCLWCICVCRLCFFFFSSRRRHTRSKRDWSSDVCSSDLGRALLIARLRRGKYHSSATPSISLHRKNHSGRARPENCATRRRGVRSEERRVGKECRYRWAGKHDKKKRERATKTQR